MELVFGAIIRGPWWSYTVCIMHFYIRPTEGKLDLKVLFCVHLLPYDNTSSKCIVLNFYWQGLNQLYKNFSSKLIKDSV